jgi:hypothetical protein
VHAGEAALAHTAQLPGCLLQQPAHVLFPSALQFSSGFGEAGWRSVLLASNEHLIPRSLTLGFQAARGSVGEAAYLQALLDGLRVQAGLLADDREVVALVLQLGMAECLAPARLEELLEAVPRHFRTVARPQVEVRLDAGSDCDPVRLRAVGCTRLTVIDRPGADGPGLLARAQPAGFTACYYQLRVPARDDTHYLQRLDLVIALGPARILLPAPCAAPADPCASTWYQAWQRLVAAGYVAIGGDHYQHPERAPPTTLRDTYRYCDMVGVPRRERTDFIGIGAGACSQVGEVLCRLDEDPARWQSRMDGGHAGVVAGLILSDDEALASDAMQRIACDHALDAADFEWSHGCTLDDAFEDARMRLGRCLAQGWAFWDGPVLRLRAEGMLLWRIIAACFRPAAAGAPIQE